MPNRALKAAIRLRPDMFAKMFHKCFVEGIFPRRWKRQTFVFILKPGKPPGNPLSYRPICLLGTMGKILESLDKRPKNWGENASDRIEEGDKILGSDYRRQVKLQRARETHRRKGICNTGSTVGTTRRILSSVYRLNAIRPISGFKTVSDEAVLVLAKTIPIDI